jgi:hypothetical protein
VQQVVVPLVRTWRPPLRQLRRQQEHQQPQQQPQQQQQDVLNETLKSILKIDGLNPFNVFIFIQIIKYENDVFQTVSTLEVPRLNP